MTAILPRSPLLAADGASLSAKEQLGKFLFFDPSLSVPEGQSCAACHGPEVGFTGPDEELNKGGAVYEGAVKGRFGNRKPPASSYAGDSPILYFDRKERVWVGGMFWDGRATGKRLKDPLAEQAQGPFPIPSNRTSRISRSSASRARIPPMQTSLRRSGEKAPWTAGRTSPPPTTGSQKVLLRMNDPRR
jgi:cytochrome c peroxidase